MKSLRDEILLCRDRRTDFISSTTVDFICVSRFHRERSEGFHHGHPMRVVFLLFRYGVCAGGNRRGVMGALPVAGEAT